MFEDACACDWSDDGEPVEVYEGKLVKARKVHKCDECVGEIKKGQQYHRASYVADGCWYHYKTCRSCYGMAVDFCCGRIPHGSLWEVLNMYLGFYPDQVPKETTPMSVRARRDTVVGTTTAESIKHMNATTAKLMAYLFPLLSRAGSSDLVRVAEREIGNLLRRGNKFSLSLSDGRVLKITVKVK